MKVRQISVFLENKKGRLLETLETLAKAKTNIRALSIADTSELGILRLIVPEPEQARKALEKDGFTVGENEVIVVGVNDKPGGLANILQILKSANINVEYLYGFVARSGNKAVVVLRTENINSGIKALQKGGAKVLSAQEVYNL